MLVSQWSAAQSRERDAARGNCRERGNVPLDWVHLAAISSLYILHLLLSSLIRICWFKQKAAQPQSSRHTCSEHTSQLTSEAAPRPHHHQLQGIIAPHPTPQLARHTLTRQPLPPSHPLVQSSWSSETNPPDHMAPSLPLPCVFLFPSLFLDSAIQSPQIDSCPTLPNVPVGQ